MSLRGKTLFITGASRGIGRAIALRAARDGANLAIVAKTAKPHRILEGTIHQTAEQVRAAGGRALAIQADVQDDEGMSRAIEKTVSEFGGLDIVVNNASALSLANTEALAMRRFDLMHQVNTRGTFLCTKLAVPHLRRAANPHVLNLAPPLQLTPSWFSPHAAYTMSKFGMSLCTLAHAAEFQEAGIAVNALWPLTTIATAAVSNVIEKHAPTRSRSPEIMADAAWFILTACSRSLTGRFLIDEEVLRENGVNELTGYDVGAPGARTVDLFVPDEAVARSPTVLDQTPLSSTITSRRDPATMSRGLRP